MKNWEVKYINSKQFIQTESGIFHYELVLHGRVNLSQSSVGESVSQVKVCPVTVMNNNEVCDFFVNPIDKVCVCRKASYAVIPWKEGIFINPVANIKELTPEEQFSKHKVLLENYIESVYVPEILSALNSTVLERKL